MAKKLDLQAGTEAEALVFADFNKPWGSGGESFTIDAFGHEKDLVGGNRWTFFAPNPLKRRCYEGFKAGQEILNLDQIVFG